MTGDRDTRWSIETLERYHDGLLDTAMAEAVAEDLRTDPVARERLASVMRLDRELHGALAGTPSADARVAGGWRVAIVAPLAVAAVIAAIVVGWIGAGAMAPPTPVEQGPALADVAPEPYRPARVVLSWPASRAGGPAMASPSVEERIDPAVEVADAIARGDVDGAARLVASTDGEAAGSVGRVFAEAFRSAVVAEEVLDRLEPAQQVELCAQLASTARLRPVAFQRLALLASDPAMADRVEAVVDRLEHRSGMLPWIRSYRLRPASWTGRRVPGAGPEGQRSRGWRTNDTLDRRMT